MDAKYLWVSRYEAYFQILHLTNLLVTCGSYWKPRTKASLPQENATLLEDILIKYYSKDLFWDKVWSQYNWCLIYWCCAMFKLMDLSWTHLFITRVLQPWLWLGEYELIRFELYKPICIGISYLGSRCSIHCL
jgi:hypothetical protein